MNWFKGNIAEAVSYSQAKKALFCVAILGTDEASQDFESLLAEEDVVTCISDNTKFVCIRLTDGSEEHRQFLQIYPSAKTPSVYCISIKGAAWCIANPNNAIELKSKLENGWTRHSEILSQVGQPLAASSGGSSQPPGGSTPASVAGPTPGASTTSGPAATATPEEPKPSLEERIERAKKLAAAKQVKRAAEEAEEQKRREKERREAGKGAIEMRRWQEEEETRRLAEERRRDKKADALLKQKLREQIAQDRLDKKMRDNPSGVPEEAQVSTPAPVLPSTPAVPVNYSGQARLQFRLPTGSSHNHTFNPDATLGEVRQFLITNAIVPFKDFTISIAFPRRQFTTEDYGATLRDLGLLPSSALLILPITDSSMISRAGNVGQGFFVLITSVVGFMLYPLTLVFTFLQRMVTPALPPPAAKKSDPNTRPPTNAASGDLGGAKGNVLGGARKKEQGSGSASAGGIGIGGGPSDKSVPSTSKAKAAKDTKEGRSGGGKKTKSSDHFGADGNVHRLHDGDSDSDDDQATWNGNSTQQM